MKLALETLRSIPFMDAVGFDQTRLKHLTGVSTDSRMLQRGNLFIALRGERFNGHNFLSVALDRGAQALLVDATWAKANGPMMSSIHVPVLIVEDTTTALGDLALAHRRVWGGKVVAIGGSNGKTTTKDMVASVLGQKYYVLATHGNLNNHIGVPLTLLRLAQRDEIAVVEFGTNHPGEIEYLCRITEPTHGLLTNIGQEHLEYFGDVSGVAKEEGVLFEWLAANGGYAIVNQDDAEVVKQARKVTRRLSYGFKGRSADLRGTHVVMDPKGHASFQMQRTGKRPVEIVLSTPGMHAAQNALAACAVGSVFTVPSADRAGALHAFQATSKRMQSIDVRGVTILNDTYNSNPDSVQAALETLASVQTSGKRIAVLSDMMELGADAEGAHARVGTLLKKHHVDYLLAYGPLSHHTYSRSTAKHSLHYDQKNVLAEYLLELVAEGDVVLIKGSRSMEMEAVVTFLTESMTRAA
jgi:UDP-N-acetylmuramoyl-tripeptide--D-alanyl-D-alanine ligase